jgi:hypothetical protein
LVLIQMNSNLLSAEQYLTAIWQAALLRKSSTIAESLRRPL